MMRRRMAQQGENGPADGANVEANGTGQRMGGRGFFGMRQNRPAEGNGQ